MALSYYKETLKETANKLATSGKGILAVDVLDNGAIGHIGGTVALGQGVAIHGDPVGKEDVEDHRLAVGAVRPCHLPRLPDLDEPNVIGRCLDDRHVVGLVDGAADAAVDRGRDAIEAVLSLDCPHRFDAGVAVAVEDQPGRAVELALDLAAFALESELLGHLCVVFSRL